MGLFNRRAEPAPSARPLRAIEMRPETLVEADRRLAEVEARVGGTWGPLSDSIRMLADGAGAVGMEEIIDKGLNPGETNRPWRWLARVASYAQAGGDDHLPARVLLFTVWWSSVQDKLGMGDFLEMRVGPVPRDVKAEITATAIESLRRLPPDMDIVPPAYEGPTAGRLLATVS